MGEKKKGLREAIKEAGGLGTRDDEEIADSVLGPLDTFYCDDKRKYKIAKFNDKKLLYKIPLDLPSAKSSKHFLEAQKYVKLRTTKNVEDRARDINVSSYGCCCRVAEG